MIKKFDDFLKDLGASLDKISDLISSEDFELKGKKLDNRDRRLKQLGDGILSLRKKLDLGRHGEISISLGRPDAIARFFAFSFVEGEKLPLVEVEKSRFFGSGVYAIYYIGDDVESYIPLSRSETPIYLGKAVPNDSAAEIAHDQGSGLWERLKKHRNNIDKGGLRSSDFLYRYAIIQSGMEGAVEDFMIRLFKPVWNKEMKICAGFGKHGDAAETRKNKRSKWDTMHPGRDWANATTDDQRSRDQIIKDIELHFINYPPIENKGILREMLLLS